MGWTEKVLSEMEKNQEIDVSELEIKDTDGNIIQTIPFKFLSASEMSKLYDHPKVRGAKGEQREIMYSQVLTFRMLQKADETLTEHDFFGLPINITGYISMKISEKMKLSDDYLKN